MAPTMVQQVIRKVVMEEVEEMRCPELGSMTTIPIRIILTGGAVTTRIPARTTRILVGEVMVTVTLRTICRLIKAAGELRTRTIPTRITTAGVITITSHLANKTTITLAGEEMETLSKSVGLRILGGIID